MNRAEPVELDELKPVGFGCYRVDVRSMQHRTALEHALLAGCNLIDTASNYTDGRSEELVGAVLEATGARAFVVTKAGYVSPAAVAELERAGVRPDRLPRIESGTPFSLDPDVLGVLLGLSRARLRRQTLDAVLLHNPEQLFQAGASADEALAALDRAFAFLEDEVAAGRLRFYGVSSNDFPTAGPGDPLDLETIVELASRRGARGLAFVQFPLNLLEREAATDAARPSLLVRAGGRVRTIANRPLNAIVDGEKVRLAFLAPGASRDDPWETCVELVSARLAALGEQEQWTSFRPMQFLRDSRDSISDPDLVDAIWANQIEPFLATLFEDDPPHEACEAFAQLRAYARVHAQAALAMTTRAAVARLIDAGLIDPDSDEPLAVAACRYCLDVGADHIVVGMRRPEYVAGLAPLFADASSSGAQ